MQILSFPEICTRHYSVEGLGIYSSERVAKDHIVELEFR